MDYILLRKHGRNFKLWAKIESSISERISSLFFFALQLGIEKSFSVVTLNICISWLPIWINQWMHISVVHIGHEGTEQYTWRNTYVSRWYFFCNVRHFLSYQYEPQRKYFIVYIQKLLIISFWKKNVIDWN